MLRAPILDCAGSQCSAGGASLTQPALALASARTECHPARRGAWPHAACCPHSRLSTVCSRSQELLTTSSHLDARSAGGGGLSTAALCCVLSSTLGLLTRPHMLRRSSSIVPCRWCAHACVQLLLPRARARPSWLVAAGRQWEAALPWRVQLHAWPLLDRLAMSARAADSSLGTAGHHGGPVAGAGAVGTSRLHSAAGAARELHRAGDAPELTPRSPQLIGGGGTAASRWLEWLGARAPPGQLLLAVVEASAVPSLPTRAALRTLLCAADASGSARASAIWPHGAAAAAGTQSRRGQDVGEYLGLSHQIASLGLGLASVPPSDWSMACGQVQPLTSSIATRGGFVPPTGTADRGAAATQAAHALLAALLSHGPFPERHAFRAGFLRWLSTTGKLLEQPLCLASLLGVCLRVMADVTEQGSTCVGHDDRCFNVCLQLLGKLVERSAAPAAGGVAEALRSTLKLCSLHDATMATLLTRAECGVTEG